MSFPTDRNPSAAGLRLSLIGLTVILCAIAYSFRFTSFLHAKEIVLGLSLVILAIMAVARREFPGAGFAAFAPLWIFLAASIVFRLLIFPAQVPSATVIEIVRWAMLLLVVAFIYDSLAVKMTAVRVLDLLILSTVIVALLGLLQYAGLLTFLFPRFEGYPQRVYSVFGNQDLYGGYVVIGLPLIVARYLDRSRCGSFVVPALAILVPGLLISGCRSAWIAAAVGVAVSIPYRRVDMRRFRRLIIAVVLLILSTALLAPDATFRRLTHTLGPHDEGTWARLWFWDGALRMFSDAPVVGVGLGNYAYWSPSCLGEALYAPNGKAHFRNELYADHPHSDPLQILAEAGIIGLLCWLWIIVRLVRRGKNDKKDEEAGWIGPEWGGLAALVVFACFNRPSESVAHSLAGLLLASMLLAGPHADSVGSSPRVARGIASGVLAVATVGLVVFWFWAVAIPSYHLRKAEDAYLTGEPSLALYERVVRHPWPNAIAHKEYAIALAEADRKDEAYLEFQKALRGLDTGDIYLALALLAADRGDRVAARAWARECLGRWPTNSEAQQLLDFGN